ncbi:MAG: amino acid adenylation domain-containing protein, partial [Chryseobacterium sp.]|nr:amino acid adenylation domain-containing protein [Chryseobacterium sp.]
MLKCKSILSHLEDTVHLCPSKPALIYENSTLTFEKLDIFSNQLAHYLKQRGNFSNIPLCFCLDQSLEKVIAMLAIWKAEGAYVSLDPLYPEARLQHVLEDTESPLLITTRSYAEKFSFFKGQIILIDEQKEEIKQMPESTPKYNIAEGMAYLAYTSGSTGVPKAVMAEHKGLNNFVEQFGIFLDPQKEDTALAISSSNFDGIVVDLWVPLSKGMTVFLYPDNRMVGEPLLHYIRESGITMLPYLPVSILATLPTDQPIGKLRKICTGGEAPIPSVIESWKKRTELINIYGPTETTVVVSGFKFDENHPITTIGKPLPNVDFYVLDDEMNPLPANETGELYIGGIQVARGYYNRPDLTAERFLEYKTPENKTVRVYKTGDLVRRLKDDIIEFVREDKQQEKIDRLNIGIETVIVNKSNPVTPKELEMPKTLIQMFEEQVHKTPDKAALILSGRSISYCSLDEKSSLVANYLIGLGIKNDDFVACYHEQSIERIISLLGILKAGAAYAPLDTTYPMERIKLMLDDTQPKVIIGSAKFSQMKNEVEQPVYFIEDILKNPSENIRQSYCSTHNHNNLAYVIHTSGTTGKPKGVLIEHQSLGNFITEYAKLLDIGEEDRTLQFSPYNFDGSVIDIWIPLTKGATVHLYPNNKLLGEHLSEFLSLHAITVIPFISPSVLSTLSQTFDLSSIRVIGTGAETCPSQVSQYWKPLVKLVNMYGPTETTVAVNEFVFDDSHPNNTIGTAIKNMRLYVLDQYLRQIPAGVTGELYISGIQLSRGYLNLPELTAEKFIKNPFTEEDNTIYSKMYKTGDLVRRLKD